MFGKRGRNKENKCTGRVDDIKSYENPVGFPFTIPFFSVTKMLFKSFIQFPTDGEYVETPGGGNKAALLELQNPSESGMQSTALDPPETVGVEV